MNVILTGATGSAGSEVLRQCIADPQVNRVTVLSRRPLGFEHEKLRVIIHSDFTKYGNVVDELRSHQACLWCLGIAQNAVSEAEYEVITYDYALAAAPAMASVNPSFRFCFLSGDGASSTEKSLFLFGRVKGRTENALAKLGHPEAYSFRPGYIFVPSIDTPTTLQRVRDAVIPVLSRLLPSLVTYGADLGRAMIYVAKQGSDKGVLSNADIEELSRLSQINSN